MKRKTKNIIMIIILLLMIGLTVFTVYLKSNTISKSTVNNTTQNITNNNNPPDMNNSSNQPPDMNSDNSQSQSRPTPPDMNDNNSQSESDRPTPPDTNNDSSTNGDKQSPPAKPGDASNDNQDNRAESQTPSTNNSAMTPPDMQQNTDTTKITTPVYFYIIFAVEGLIISIIISYLIMSNFNKKDAKETLSNSDKKIIYILLVLIMTGAITATSSLVDFPVNNQDSTQMTQNQTSSVSYNSAKEITTDTTLNNESYKSTTADENVISASGNIKATLEDLTISKSGDSDGGDNTSFYGTNSAIIAKNGANLTIKNSTIETDATGANGVFSYGGSATTNNSSSDGTTVNIKNTKITTKKDNSGGIMTTGGGVTNATNLTITTEGTSSAAIRSDRGGGTVSVNKGTYTTNGKGSPTIYSTADITVKNATLNSTASEGVVIEGKNKVTLENVKLTDNNTKLNGQSTTYKNIFLYQSMSGDAADGSSEFISKDSTITTKKGDTLYVTNTKAKITLENNTITNKDSEGNFIRIQKDSWGNSGSNGGDVALTLTNQKVSGNIVVDEISSLSMTMSSKSSYTGAINKDNTAKNIELKLDKSSKIKLTSDSYVTKLTDDDTSYSNIDFNGYKLYVNGKAIN